MIFQYNNNPEKILSGEKIETRRIKKEGDRIFWEGGITYVHRLRKNGTPFIKYQTKQILSVQPSRGEHGLWYDADKRIIDIVNQPYSPDLSNWWDNANVFNPKHPKKWLLSKGLFPLQIKIIGIREERLGLISDESVKNEGFDSKESFFSVWDIPLSSYVIVLRFELVNYEISND